MSWRGFPVSYIDKPGPELMEGEPLREKEPCFRRPDGEWEKIWFPDGPPKWQKEEERPPDVGDKKDLEEAYRLGREKGTWGEKMPEVPPRRQWVGWEF
jgi:nucleoporin NUP42